MARRIDIAKRLEELGLDPVEGMVRIASRAEASGNLPLAAKIMADLLEYTAPKLKSMEVSIEPETRDFLDRQARLDRIASILKNNPQLLGKLEEDGVLDVGEVKVLKHIPEEG